MKNIAAETETRPKYHDGQLLLAEDFLAEQNFHIEARRHHNLNFHGWGVLHGLTVSRDGEDAVAIEPGVAIDEKGNEIALKEVKHVPVPVSEPNAAFKVFLAYQETATQESPGHPRLTSSPLVTIGENPETTPAVILAYLQLDARGKLGDHAVDHSQVKHARVVARPITAAEVDDSIKRGWLRFPFRPFPMVRGPEKEDDIPPAFLVGATEAHSPPPAKGEKDKGAGGSMHIPIPPAVKQITRLRVFGEHNDGEVNIDLIVGGWDVREKKHFRKIILHEKVAASAGGDEPGGPSLHYDSHEAIKEKDLDPEWNTLSLELWGTARVSISLVAVEFGY